MRVPRFTTPTRSDGSHGRRHSRPPTPKTTKHNACLAEAGLEGRARLTRIVPSPVTCTSVTVVTALGQLPRARGARTRARRAAAAMPAWGQLVCGPPGSGKTTYTRALHEFLNAAGR